MLQEYKNLKLLGVSSRIKETADFDLILTVSSAQASYWAGSSWLSMAVAIRQANIVITIFGLTSTRSSGIA